MTHLPRENAMLNRSTSTPGLRLASLALEMWLKPTPSRSLSAGE